MAQMINKVSLSVFLLAGSTAFNPLWAQEPSKVLWGDTHLHTYFSADAYLAGNRSVGPDEAFRAAKGEPIHSAVAGVRVQLREPLDFLAVADHAGALGLMGAYNENDSLIEEDTSFYQTIKGSVIQMLFQRGVKDPKEAGKRVFDNAPLPEIAPGDTKDPVAGAGKGAGALYDAGIVSVTEAHKVSETAWKVTMEAADRHNDPGHFTALVGWEWTQTNNGANLHRVVVSDAEGETASKFEPFGADDGPYPEDLWNFLDETSKEFGVDFVSIPHNSNISKGYMFAETTLKGQPITAAYAKNRARWESLVEVTQFKGDSETHPDLSPNDEFADFEKFKFYLQRPPQGGADYPYVANAGDYVRSAFKRGMEIENTIGVNPFKMGVIGSTDSHTGIPSAEETNFWGKVSLYSVLENKRRDGEPTTGQFNDWNMSASGLAAVWAPENTRKDIVAAFKRRETYATTGPRIQVRVFAGWDFSAEDLANENMASIGYERGVPMGGDLADAPGTTAPVLMIRAVKGPMDHNLDRVQVIKGWIGDDGKALEKIYNVAWSDNRQLDAKGGLPAVGNTVNLKTGMTVNSIGAPEFSTLWTDPEFNASQQAFYYIRVLQIPTIRHSKLDANALGMETPLEGPATLQERAYTSPIWYTPQDKL